MLGIRVNCLVCFGNIATMTAFGLTDLNYAADFTLSQCLSGRFVEIPGTSSGHQRNSAPFSDSWLKA